MADKWKAGDRARYEGIMERRCGQEVVVLLDNGGLISVEFPGGAIIGVAPASLKVV